MRRLARLRPTPAGAMAAVALFATLVGGAYAAAKIGTSQLKNGAVTAEKLAAQAVTTKKLARDAVTGKKADESTFGPVPSAENITGRTEFWVQLTPGQTETIAENGPLALRAQCIETAEGNDIVRIIATTTAPGSALQGRNRLNSAATGFLEPTTLPGASQLLRSQAPIGTPSVNNDNNKGFVAAPTGEALTIDGEATVLALNYAGGECRASGIVEALNP